MTSEPKHRTVVEGKIRHLSVSAIQMFDTASSDAGCEMHWWFKYVQGRKEPERAWHEEGNAVDQQVTHYLATGEDVLGRVARPGIPFLPAPGRDLLLQWGLDDRPRPVDAEGNTLNYFPPEQSLVRAAGIPLIGFSDIINGREEYLVPIDEYGEHVELRHEPNVVEVADIKTAKTFRYTKKHNELGHNPQMLGYGKFVAQIVPQATHVRLSHNALVKEGVPKAIKRSVLLPVSEVHARWSAVELVAERMKVVAATQRAEDVPGNLSACESFGGCPHKPYCHHHRSQNPIKRVKMGLLKNRTTPAPNGAPPPAAPNGASNTPWIPPQPPPQQAFAPPAQHVPVAPAQTMPPPVPQPQVVAPHTAPSGQWIKAVKATQGQKYIIPPMNALTMYLASTNGQQSFLPITNGQAGGTPILVGYEYDVFELLPFEPTQPVAPAPQQAAPPPPPAPAPQVAREPSAPPPPPPLAAQSQIHPPPHAPVPPPPPGAPAKKQRKLKPQDLSTTPDVPTAPAASGFALYVNAIPNGPHTDLSGYVAEAAQALQEQFGVIDIRIASNDSPLGFARWRGLLAQVAKQDPPPPGTYVAFTRGNELTEIVVEALSPLCAPGQLVRGI